MSKEEEWFRKSVLLTEGIQHLLRDVVPNATNYKDKVQMEAELNRAKDSIEKFQQHLTRGKFKKK